MARRSRRWAIAAWAACLPLAEAAPPAVEMASPLDFPNAGIALAVPKGFELRGLGSPYDLLNAVMLEDSRPAQGVTLSAFPVAGKLTAEEFASAKMAELKNNLAIRHLTLLKKTPMPVAGLAGSAHLLSYTFRGVKTLAAQVFFFRELRNSRFSICYLLTVVCEAEKQAALLPTLGAVAKSARLTAVQHPSLAGDLELGEPVEESQLGYSIRPPKAWYAIGVPSGLQMGQLDYLAAGSPTPMPFAQLVVGAAPADAATAEACSKRNLATARNLAAERQDNVLVVSEGPATLGELPAWQFILIQTPKESAAPRPEGQGASLVLASRTAYVGEPSGASKVYTLVLTARGDEGRPTAALLDRIAASFKVIQVATQPTTEPATAPAIEPATQPGTTPVKKTPDRPGPPS